MNSLAEFLSSEMVERIYARLESYSGDARVLESAIGTLFLGALLGWKPLLLIHSPKTVQRYQVILDLDFKEVLPEYGSHASKAEALQFSSDQQDSFWKIVKGEAPGRSVQLITNDRGT